MDTCAAPNPEKSTLQAAIMPKLPELPITVTKEKPSKDNDNDAFKTASDAEESEEEDLKEVLVLPAAASSLFSPQRQTVNNKKRKSDN